MWKHKNTYRILLGNVRTIGFLMNICRKINTYKGKLSNIYAGQASQIHENAAISYMSDFPVRETLKSNRTIKHTFVRIYKQTKPVSPYERINHKLVWKSFLLCLDQACTAQMFPAGYIHSFWRRIRFCSQKLPSPSGRQEQMDFRIRKGYIWIRSSC